MQHAPPVSVSDAAGGGAVQAADPRATSVHGGTKIISEQTYEDVISAMVKENPTLLDEQWGLYHSMRSASDIRRERWRLGVMQTESDAVFMKIEAEADAADAHAIADGDAAAYVDSSASVAALTPLVPGGNDHEAGPSMSIMDLTSAGDIHEAADSSEDE